LKSLADETYLSDDLLRQLMSVGEVDLLVGILSHSSANTMRAALRSVENSLQQNFVRQRVAIISVDGGAVEDAVSEASADGQRDRHAFAKGLSSLRTIHRITAGFSAAPSAGLALRTILASADLLRAKATAVVSPATSSTAPDWIANLLRPAYRDNFDFVAPMYSRHKFQGLLARNLLYPMTRALFGRRIRELYSDEWGFSNRLGSYCLNQDVWHEEPIRTRPEAWMGISAMTAQDFRCCQVFLGEKPQPVAGSGPDIVEALRQTVGSLFWCLETHQSEWLGRNGSEPVTTIGPDHAISAEPMDLDRARMFEMFQSGVQQLEPILYTILSPETHTNIQTIAALDPNAFRFGTDLWVKILYDFASGYHHSVINRDHLVQALVPLYRGKIYSFLVEHSNSSAADMEAEGENLCLEFERQKPYLIEKWKAGVEVKS
jgi:hypothetical protein